ncbi:VanW family protein [Phytoactinopolyspora limicola]|uniref:VanW family protein n=1 Tax=Phytoactinopolyspora limicola TaxID=2715536 RepID=UPI001407604C|nr:VanW family protein [Phytoactinopolyspora limicola]
MANSSDSKTNTDSSAGNGGTSADAAEEGRTDAPHLDQPGPADAQRDEGNAPRDGDPPADAAPTAEAETTETTAADAAEDGTPASGAEPASDAGDDGAPASDAAGDGARPSDAGGDGPESVAAVQDGPPVADANGSDPQGAPVTPGEAHTSDAGGDGVPASDAAGDGARPSDAGGDGPESVAAVQDGPPAPDVTDAGPGSTSDTDDTQTQEMPAPAAPVTPSRGRPPVGAPTHTSSATSVLAPMPMTRSTAPPAAQEGLAAGAATRTGEGVAAGVSPDGPPDVTGPSAAPVDEPPRRRRGRMVAVVAGAVIVVLGAVYGVMYLMAGDKLASNATVAGVDVGGLSPAEAEARLTAELPAIVDAPIQLQLGDTGTTYELIPSEAGLAVDIPATLSAVPGGSANPLSLIQALFGGDEVTPRPAVDDDALRGALNAIAEESDTAPVNAAVGFDDGEVVTSEPVAGTSLDVDGAAELLTAAFFGTEAREMPIGQIAVPVDEVTPAVDAAELERAVAEFADPAMSGPVTVVAGTESVDLPAAMIGEVLSLSPDENGRLQPDLDGAALVEQASDLLAQIGQEGQDATVRIEGGSPTVVPAQSGRGVETDSLGDLVLLALTEDGSDRRAEVELVEVEPELTTEGAEELGVKEVVAEFTTNYPAARYRDVNIGRAAELINNTLLLPGDEFSLNGTVGERTEANGFTSGIIINQGRLEDAMGGGVSQVATTTYHAAALAGLEDVEHWPHSIYFDRYPLGHEATVAWGSKDLRFKNDTPYGVLIETRHTSSAGGGNGSLTVRIWSTEHYRVELSTSERGSFTAPRTIHDTSSSCQAQAGSQGFTVTAYRKVWGPDGDLVKDEANPWTYNPNHRVVCGPEPGDD